MAKAIVIYDSKYGNTKVVGERIAEIMQDKGNAETDLIFVEDVDVKQVPAYDIIVLGTPNHMGRRTGKVKKLLKKLGGVNLAGKKIALFDTCFKTEEGKATGSMEKMMRDHAPDAQLLTPHLSVLVDGTKGPIAEGELSKVEEFGERIAGST
ncbi:MAG: flavodoxin family protein [Thermoplasmata archaeon]|nr:flavodoxin family protein [Thermoplasmata archaeon]